LHYARTFNCRFYAKGNFNMAAVIFSSCKTKAKQPPPKVEILSQDPLIRVVDNFLTNKECQWIIDKAKPMIKRAVVSSAEEGVKSMGRTGSVAWFSPESGKLVEELIRRVANLADLPMEFSESLQVLYYGPEQLYNAHWDAYDLNTERGIRCCSDRGQRVRTALAYLSDVESGGQTKFPRLNVEVNPQKGRLVLFDNCIQGSSERHQNSLHAAAPVIAGEKWAITLFFRDRPYRK
jgi:prolyl 4-hydroxylase